jgi:Fe-S-cluster containining protein
MKTKKINRFVPDLYAGFLPDFFNNKIPEESFAFCMDCTNARTGPPGKKLQTKPFRPDVKCCSYFPGLPNYLLGAILADSDPALEEGKRRVRELINKRTGVSPAGIQAPKKYSLLFTAAENSFGQCKSLLCPYYHKSKGICTIWKYREATCSTYYCRHVASAAGKAFWGTLKNVLFSVEKRLCGWVLLESGFDFTADILNAFSFGIQKVNRMSAAELEDVPPTAEEYLKPWQNWAGKEEEFYMHSYRLVQQISPQLFKEIMGIDLKILLQDLGNKWEKAVGMPSKLIKNPGMEFPEAGSNYVVPFKSIDTAVEVPAFVLDSFDGVSPWREVQKYLGDKFNVDIDETFILSLYHYRILIAKEL